MTATDLKTWMTRHNKRVEDVASLIGVSHQTVSRFLKGRAEPRPIVKAAFQRLVKETQGEEPPPPKAA